MTLSKTLYMLLSNGSTQEEPSGHHCKFVDREVKNQNNKQKYITPIVISRPSVNLAMLFPQ